jgi:acetylornithine deacetylase/succinyl-diaminopimelate desuccinylase family protein
MQRDEAIATILHHIDSDTDFITFLTQEVIRIPSVNPKFQTAEGLNRESDVQNLLAGQLERIGLSTRRQEVFPDRPNLIATLPGEASCSLLLNGHIDVVPTGEVASWTTAPFGGEIRDGRIWGRGALDMKSGLAAGVAALRAIHLAGYRPKGRIDFHSVVDEEAGGFGAMHAARNTPPASAGIVLEPTWGDIMPAEGGLEWVRVSIPGKAAHAGWRYNSIYPQRFDDPKRLEPGVNAIELGALFILALREYERDRGRRCFHPLLPPGIATINPGVVLGGAMPDAMGQPRVLTNPAIIPDAFVLDLDLKFMPDETSAEVRADFERFVAAFAQQHSHLRDTPPRVIWELRGLHFPPLNTPTDHPIVDKLSAARAALGLETRLSAMVGVCDAAHYAGAGVPCVIHGCAGDGLHGPDENVTIDSLIETTRVLAMSIAGYCGLEKR